MGSVSSTDRHTLSNEKYRATLARIEALFDADPDAEELASSQKLLGALYRTLDSGRSVARPDGPRGLPLSLAVKAIKSSWHADGTWPLIGRDEAEKHRVCNPHDCVVRTMQVSQHRHKDLVRNDAYELGKQKRTILPCSPTSHEIWFVERSADAIAAAYASRSHDAGSSSALHTNSSGVHIPPVTALAEK
ncbi:hypothetical protein MOBT1_003204 [Malassezia obtusa]|uniref:Uncharacterized protein n=1 Tax=Malassezia obtusa TaxID=76774 RepID=A0AAF0E2N2_9BASI|nr:hypothetical protein MOBT1_003204 [Malassezia obtusa]